LPQPDLLLPSALLFKEEDEKEKNRKGNLVAREGWDLQPFTDMKPVCRQARDKEFLHHTTLMTP
ncbi:MAG: hypothetical protein ACREGC_04465, partial [Minisyncoccia bacterium]